MQQELTVTATETDIDDSMPTPGAQLKAAREKASMSVKDVAQKLYFTAAKITALEGDQYEKLPSPTFVQGYIRKYAALVELDSDKLVESYNRYLQSMQETVEQVMVPQSQVDRLVLGKKPPKWILPASLFAVAALVLISVVYFGLDSMERTERPNLLQTEEIAVPITSTTIDQTPNGEIPISQPTTVDTVNVQNSMSDAERETSDVTFSGNNLDEVDANANALNISSSDTVRVPDQLVFVFTDRCWLEVRDSSGAVIHAELHEQNIEPVLINGMAPFSVMLGNARAASVAFNGEAVDFDIRPGHDTARFTIQ